jgi:hypothetical protein
MTKRPSARVRANRANAAKSTGPKTTQGKARIARNALIHGLAAAQNASSSKEVDMLSEALLKDIGAVRTALIEVAARDLAEAQLYVLSVRAVRQNYWLRFASMSSQHVGQPQPVTREPEPFVNLLKRRAIEVMTKNSARQNEPLKNIEALERYERQALARRKWASRAFSEAVAIKPRQGS